MADCLSPEICKVHSEFWQMGSLITTAGVAVFYEQFVDLNIEELTS